MTHPDPMQPEAAPPVPTHPVTLAEVAAYAKPGHRACQSSGVLTTWARIRRDRRDLTATVETFTETTLDCHGDRVQQPAPLREPCPCALARFIKAHGHEAARDDQGRWWWVASAPSYEGIRITALRGEPGSAPAHLSPPLPGEDGAGGYKPTEADMISEVSRELAPGASTEPAP